MSEQNKAALSNLMKKQISEKSTKKTTIAGSAHSKNPADAKNSSGDEKEDGKNEEEKTEEEQLEEAKKASRSKASQYDNSEMIKKMIVENVVKYTVVICVLIIASIGLIKFGAAILAFLNGLLYKMMMGAFGG